MKQAKSELRNNIHKMLSIYSNYIEYQNANGLFDINRDCENIFCELLNELYDLDLHNLNNQMHNYPAIDLADTDEEICVQVTSQSKSSKIIETIETFERQGMRDNFKELWIFILGKKRSYKNSFADYVKIIDFKDLGLGISNCHQKHTLLQIQEILHDELGNLNLIDNFNNNSLLNNVRNDKIKLGKRYLSFMKYCDYPEDATQQDIDDINEFAEQLSNLNYELREVIYAGCKKRLIYKNYHTFISNVQFNASTVATYLGDKQEVLNRYRQLMQLGYLSDDEDDILYFTFYNRGKDYDVLKSIADYCAATKNDIKAVIINLDFSCLD